MGRLAQAYRVVRDSGRLMAGMPSYDAYLAHMRRDHPEAEPMDEVEFLRDRQNAHFGGSSRGGFRCC